MKTGVISYSFWQYLCQGKITQIDTVRLAKEIGFDSISFDDLTPPEGVSQEEYAKQLKVETDKYSLCVSAYIVGGNFAVKDENKLGEEIKRICECVDIARILGAKYLRYDVMFDYNEFPSFYAALPTMVKAIRMVADYAQQYGIKTLVENHGYICQDPDRVERLICEVNHPNYGLLLDIGNFMCADVKSVDAVSRLAYMAEYVHAKDFKLIPYSPDMEAEGFESRGCNRLLSVPVGTGDANAAQCLAILKKHGFDGYVDIEYEGSLDCVEGVKASLENIRNILKNI